MKKRPRMKFRLREFQEMGLSVQFDLENLSRDEAYFTFWNKLFVVIEANNLLMGGGFLLMGGDFSDFFTQTNSRRTTT